MAPRRGSPRIAQISPDGDLVRQLERFKGAVSGAADAADAAGKKQAKAAEKSSEDLGKAVNRFVFQDVGRSAIASLGQAGANSADAGFAVARAASQSAPALGQTLGTALGGPVGTVLGGLAGTAVGAGIEQGTSLQRQAREQAIAETTALFSPAAAQGKAITKEEMAEVLEQRLAIALARLELGAQVRNAAPSGF